MRKDLVIFTYAIILFVVGSLVGYAYTFPSDPNKPAFAVERTVSGNSVTLRIYNQALPQNEIVVLTDTIPYGGSLLSGASITPETNDNLHLVWILAKNPPQQFEGRTISYSIPTTITYKTNTNLPANQFVGDWALDALNLHGVICNGVCPSESAPVTIMDLLNAITQYKNKTLDIMGLLDIIQRYKQGL
jgi:uncharacterized membrane protein